MTDTKGQVKSASRVLELLELLTASTRPLTFSEISLMLDIPISSTHALLHTLVARGYIVRNRSQAYALGSKLFELSQKYLEHLDIIEIANPRMIRMREISGETISFGVVDGRDVVLIQRIESPQALRIGNTPGNRLPLYASAMGKAILATWSDEEIDRLFPSSALAPITTHTITHKQDLMKSLRQVRKSGLAYDMVESTEGVCAVAAAIKDAKQETTFSLAVVMPETRAKGEHWKQAGELVRSEAKRIGDEVGWSQW